MQNCNGESAERSIVGLGLRKNFTRSKWYRK